jgi:7-cyano-7-deazaguanine synthase
VPGKAVVLLSGGLDSATVLGLARAQGFDLHSLCFRYGQRHEVETIAARRVAEAIGVRRHLEATVDLRVFGGSALTSDLSVPKGRLPEAMSDDIPVTYVPARNTVFLSYALAWAEVLGSSDIFIGVNAQDRGGYPDCRPEYIAAYQQMARLATRAGVEGRPLTIHTPLMAMTKTEIVRRGIELEVDYALTSSCYDPSPGGIACGACDACVLRRAAFAENGRADPVPYRNSAP